MTSYMNVVNRNLMKMEAFIIPTNIIFLKNFKSELYVKTVHRISTHAELYKYMEHKNVLI